MVSWPCGSVSPEPRANKGGRRQGQELPWPSAAVKGFAVTLVLGLLTNVFTSVFVSRLLFEWELGQNGFVRKSGVRPRIV